VSLSVIEVPGEAMASMGAPPGARFDPVGPGPLSGRGPGIGRGGPLGSRFSGDPDNDELMPPGVVSGTNVDLFFPV
jgi:hypothetical protein